MDCPHLVIDRYGRCEHCFTFIGPEPVSPVPEQPTGTNEEPDPEDSEPTR
jgi:hypothetical protein